MVCLCVMYGGEQGSDAILSHCPKHMLYLVVGEE